MNSRRSWIEVDLNTLITNLRIYQSLLTDNQEIMAVVKADAYGHGDKIVARCLSAHGITNFAVSNIDEAIHIREAGVNGNILILGYTPMDRLDDLVNYDITQTLLSEEYAKMVVERKVPIKCQFAIDTGMRRIGLNTDDLDKCEYIIRKYSDKLMLNGVFTHLCVADTSSQDDFTRNQINLFDTICKRLSDLRLPYCHCMNSAGGLWHRSEFSAFARLGIILYGLKPDYMNNLPDGFKPVLSWKSVVSMIKDVKVGDTIGYGRTFIVNKPMKIATIPTGYADGYSRLLSNKGVVLVNGKKAPIVGRICMDQLMADVTEIPNVRMGTEVVLIGRSGYECITADDIAHQIGTIGYEIVCGINKRVDRIYIDNDCISYYG